MSEKSKPFSIGSSVVILDTEEVGEVIDYGFFRGEEVYTVKDEDGVKMWYYRDEIEDFHSWMMNEIEFDF